MNNALHNINQIYMYFPVIKKIYFSILPAYETPVQPLNLCDVLLINTFEQCSRCLPYTINYMYISTTFVMALGTVEILHNLSSFILNSVTYMHIPV